MNKSICNNKIFRKSQFFFSRATISMFRTIDIIIMRNCNTIKVERYVEDAETRS